MTYLKPTSITGLLITGKVKTADTSRTNTASATDDTDLVVAVKANTRYVVSADLIYSSSLIAGFKMGWGAPAGATMQFVNLSTSGGILQNVADLLGISVSTTNPNYMYLRGILKTGASGGNISVKWAQNIASNLSSAALKADSSLTLIELV